MLTFVGVDATLFNFGSDLFATTAQIALILAIGQAFAFLRSWHLRQGKPIPVRVLDYRPTDFFSASYFSHALHWSRPALILSVLLAFHALSHSVADLGLSFITVETKGPNDTVLNLSRRNPSRLLQLSGDPTTYRTMTFPTSYFTAKSTGDYSVFRAELRLTDNFLKAIDNVALGVSPIATTSDRDERTTRRELNYGNMKAYFHVGNPTISQIDLELPLECSTNQMVPLRQQTGGIVEGMDNLIENTAYLPDCDLKAPRPTGILGNGSSGGGTAEIYEFVQSEPGQDSIFLMKEGELVETFTLAPWERSLARDRSDWKMGRTVPTITGVQFGDLSIALRTVTLATGSEGFSVLNDDSTEWVRMTYYVLVGNVDGRCPPSPTGKTLHWRTECVVFAWLECTTFPEDYETVSPLDYSTNEGVYFVSTPEESVCRLEALNIVWGSGFIADDELVVVMSAVLSRLKPEPYLQDLISDTIVINAALAAMFALGSIDELPSVLMTVSPRINALYISFMVIPVVLALVIILVILPCRKRNYVLSVPNNAWELLLFGKIDPAIPMLPDRPQEYPEVPNSLALRLGGDGDLGIYDDDDISNNQSHNNSDSNHDETPDANVPRKDLEA